MNIRKNVDYSVMFDAIQVAMSADMSQLKLYYELGRFICQRTEKGAAVAAAEYLQQNYPGVSGLSPRNLRRMRNFYHMYEGNPELLDLAMQIGWTQNVVILEADLNTEERRWYLCAVRRWGWSKAELLIRIESQAHQEVHLDELENQCYTECKNNELECTKYYQNSFLCYRNIFRSPMAEFVTKDLVKTNDPEQEFHIESAATSTVQISNPLYPLARTTEANDPWYSKTLIPPGETWRKAVRGCCMCNYSPTLKEEIPKMVVTDTILGLIADIGLDAAKGRYKIKQDESQARVKLTDYLARQQKYNFNCSLEEEVDFEGLAEYIRGNLMDDVKDRLFGTRKERGIARQAIADKAEYYAQAKTSLSKKRARYLAVTAVDILKNFYRNKAERDLLFVAAEIEDTVISEMTDQHKEIGDRIDALDKKFEDSSLLSIDKSLMLAEGGRLDAVEENLSVFFAALSSKHDLRPYYGFAMDGQTRLKSIPLRSDAIELYPPHLEITATSFKLGGVPLQSVDHNTFSQAYRSQSLIEFDVVAAKKYLGNILDPIQHEAEGLPGAHMVMKPPSFPKAFPCSVVIDGETIVDYLLLRTKRIEDDETAIITNDEQKDFNFKVTLMVNAATTNLNLTITPINPSNVESLKYRQFLKRAMSAKNIALKSLKHNTIFISTKTNLIPHNCEKLDIEIEFLKRLIAIETYFHVALLIPEEITVEDHRLIDRLYSMIIDGKYCGTCSRFTMSFELSQELRISICHLGDKACGFAYSMDEEANLFNQKLCFRTIRKIDCLRLENFEKLKAKLDVLDDGDILKIVFISDTDNSDAHYSDMFYSEEVEKQLFQPSVFQQG